MNFRMTWSAQGHQVVGMFVEDAHIGPVMHFGGRPVSATFANTFSTTKCINSALAPELTAEIPLICFEGFLLLAFVAP